MFNSKWKTYSRKVVSISTNTYGEDVETYSAASNISMFISLQTDEMNTSNDMRIQQCSHIGLTHNTLSIGDLIDDKYIVKFINKAGKDTIVFMKEIESNGIFN